MHMYVEVEFGDLSSDKRDSLLEEVKCQLIEDWKDEGERVKEKGQSWYEAFCRYNDIDEMLWDEDFDWKYAVESFAEERAENKLYRAFKYVEVQIEL